MEEGVLVLLKRLNDRFQQGVKDVDCDFPMRGGGRTCGLVKTWKEGGPLDGLNCELDIGDGGYGSGEGMSDNGTDIAVSFIQRRFEVLTIAPALVCLTTSPSSAVGSLGAPFSTSFHLQRRSAS